MCQAWFCHHAKLGGLTSSGLYTALIGYYRCKFTHANIMVWRNSFLTLGSIVIVWRFWRNDSSTVDGIVCNELYLNLAESHVPTFSIGDGSWHHWVGQWTYSSDYHTKCLYMSNAYTLHACYTAHFKHNDVYLSLICCSKCALYVWWCVKVLLWHAVTCAHSYTWGKLGFCPKSSDNKNVWPMTTVLHVYTLWLELLPVCDCYSSCNQLYTWCFEHCCVCEWYMHRVHTQKQFNGRNCRVVDGVFPMSTHMLLPCMYTSRVVLSKGGT